MSTLPNPVAIAADNQKLAALLRASRTRFLSSFADVAEQDCRTSAEEGAWSVLDCVEHIAAAERLMLKLLQEQRRPRASDAPNREQIFLERMGARTRKVESPESGRPRGRFPSLAEARDQFELSRAAAIRFAEQNTEDFRATEVTHPHPLVGDVSAYEMLIIIAKHAERHALQIEEIKTTLGLRTAQLNAQISHG
jgi:uncharacterized damage-inducible protein DinB